MRNWRRHLIGLIVIVGTVACQASSPPSSTPRGDDLLGERFRCHSRCESPICLGPLRYGCILSVAFGGGIPSEPNDKLVLIHGDQARLVKRPADLVGCVDIKNGDYALEYLRFFSSYRTVYLFAEEELEAYEGDCLVCLPSERWEALKLTPPTVMAKEDGFEVARYVFRPTANIPEVQLFRVIQRVGSNGEILTLYSEPLPMTWQDRLTLRFPMFP
jgi:hypothetical protein